MSGTSEFPRLAVRMEDGSYRSDMDSLLDAFRNDEAEAAYLDAMDERYEFLKDPTR